MKKSLIRIDILSAVPEIMESALNASILKIARDKGIAKILLHNLHDYASDKFKHIDDYPYGGAAGMIIQCEPLFKAIETLKSERDYDEIIFMAADGERLNQSICNELSLNGNIIIIAGHYKGIDQRVRDFFVTREISIGDYVLTGGEIPAMTIIDSVTRLLPGVLGKYVSSKDESHSSDGYIEYPHYTRPEDFEGRRVPEVLLSGNHGAIKKWREEQSRKQEG